MAFDPMILAEDMVAEATTPRVATIGPNGYKFF
jgi:hypothetical protein